MENLISIIIPVYNVESYLKKCLDSIINQTYKNIEIIIVNDGSTDKSLQICKEYRENDSRIKLISHSNIGISQSRNIGIQNANGKYLMFVDSDDWIDYETCQNAIQKIEEYNSDLILFSYIKEYESSSESKYILPKQNHYTRDNIYTLQRRLVGLFEDELQNPEHADSLVTVWGKLYKTNIIKENKLYFEDTKNIGTAEDMLFNLHYFKYINTAFYIHKSYYHYRKNNIVSFTTAYKYELYKQWQNLFSKISEFLDANAFDSSFKIAYNNRVSMSVIGLGLNELNSTKNLFSKANSIKKIINAPNYRKSICTLKLKYFPLHWKLFFFFAKHKMAFPLMLMLMIIRKIIKK